MKGQTVFLSILLFLFPTLTSGYGATGHARQQLRLIASELITPALDETAMRLDLPALPLTLVAGEDEALADRLDVLVAERILQREEVVTIRREASANGWVTRRVLSHRYWRPLPLAPVAFGSARLVGVDEVWMQPRAGRDTRVQVRYRWRADALAEWVWAMAFDGETRLERLKASPADPLAGRATLTWRDGRWVLSDLRPFAS